MPLLNKQQTANVRRGIAVIFALGISVFICDSVHAAEYFYTFRSVHSSGNANWCIEVPDSEYKSGKRLATASCNGKPNQIFGYESSGTLVAGGLCLEGLAGKPNPSPSAGDPIVIDECDGSKDQIWGFVPFRNTPDVFAIVNSEGWCVTASVPNIKQGGRLSLAQCTEMPQQGWTIDQLATTEPEYYWYSGHRFCWYDSGWQGPGWYWCGENFNQGTGWGGPIGWRWWHHHGHLPHRARPHHLPPHQARPHHETPRRGTPRHEPPVHVPSPKAPPRREPKHQVLPSHQQPHQAPPHQEMPRRVPRVIVPPHQPPSRREPLRHEQPHRALPRHEAPRREPPRHVAPRQAPTRSELRRPEPPRQTPNR
jgi:Ricin-type beta-trefoil lectin domain